MSKYSSRLSSYSSDLEETERRFKAPGLPSKNIFLIKPKIRNSYEIFWQSSRQDPLRRRTQNCQAPSMCLLIRWEDISIHCQHLKRWSRLATVPSTPHGTSTRRVTRSGWNSTRPSPATCSPRTRQGLPLSSQLRIANYLFFPRFYKPKLHKIVKDPYAEKKVEIFFWIKLNFLSQGRGMWGMRILT